MSAAVVGWQSGDGRQDGALADLRRVAGKNLPPVDFLQSPVFGWDVCVAHLSV